jgi:hypothetical protein
VQHATQQPHACMQRSKTEMAQCLHGTLAKHWCRLGLETAADRAPDVQAPSDDRSWGVLPSEGLGPTMGPAGSVPEAHAPSKPEEGASARLGGATSPQPSGCRHGSWAEGATGGLRRTRLASVASTPLPHTPICAVKNVRMLCCSCTGIGLAPMWTAAAAAGIAALDPADRQALAPVPASEVLSAAGSVARVPQEGGTVEGAVRPGVVEKGTRGGDGDGLGPAPLHAARSAQTLPVSPSAVPETLSAGREGAWLSLTSLRMPRGCSGAPSAAAMLSHCSSADCAPGARAQRSCTACTGGHGAAARGASAAMDDGIDDMYTAAATGGAEGAPERAAGVATAGRQEGVPDGVTDGVTEGGTEEGGAVGPPGGVGGESGVQLGSAVGGRKSSVELSCMQGACAAGTVKATRVAAATQQLVARSMHGAEQMHGLHGMHLRRCVQMQGAWRAHGPLTELSTPAPGHGPECRGMSPSRPLSEGSAAGARSA